MFMMDFESHGDVESKRKSRLLRVFAVLNIFFLVLIVLAVAIIIRFMAVIKEEKAASNVCLTTECVRASADILDFIDTKIDPCHDFYEFSCGTFLNDTFLTGERVSTDVFSIVREKTHEQLASLIDNDIKSDELHTFQVAKKFYRACMNGTRIEEQGLQPMVDIMKSVGGWPCVEPVDSWNPTNKWNWMDANKAFADVGLSLPSIISLSVDTDMKNSSGRIIVLDEASLGLSRQLLIGGMNDSLTKAYYEYMVDMAVIFGAEKIRAKTELHDSLQFEINLANISLPMEERRNSSELYNPLTIKQMQAKYPYVDWLKFVNQLLPEKLSVDENEVVVVSSLKYFDKLGKLLATTSNRTISNYLIWRTIDYASYYLSNAVRKRQLEFSTVTTGKKEYPPRWKECISMANNKLSVSLGALYIREYFEPEAKIAATEMVNSIHNEFKEILRKNAFMDGKTKQSALEKVNAMASHIGYPDELLDDQKLEKYHKGVEIDSNSLLNSVLQLNIFNSNYSFNELRLPVNKSDWITHAAPTFINAYYSFEENSIELPAGILQGMFFDASRPRYMNYGGMGFIIGHEITHGFDDEGRQFDLNGNLVDWWNNGTEAHFLERAKCIIDQYSNYTEEKTKLKINGINTQGENIADNGGLKQSYNAYVKWAKEHGPEKRLPALEKYSPEQMFWISAALTWCSVERTEYMKLRVLNGVHAPDKYRVLGSLSNSEDFARDFKCPIDSPMNPKKKCSVW